MATTHTVGWGDTLSELAVQYGTTVAKLVELNDITDPDFIVVGQVLKLTGDATTNTNKTSKPTIKVFGLQTGTARTIYATWTWSKEYTENYQVMWYYDSGDGVWFVGNDSTTEYKQSTYAAPENAKRVKFKVKAISKKKTVNNKETSYWTAGWSSEKMYNFKDSPPEAPAAPSVTIEKYKLTAELNNLKEGITRVQFQVVKNNKTVFKTGTANVTTNYASFSCTLDAGNEYKVRCRAYSGSVASDWSPYSESKGTIPSTPSGITTCKATSESSVYLEWAEVVTAKTYDIEYTTKKEYFDGSNSTTTQKDIEFTHYELTGLEMGEEYFFRVRAVNSELGSDGASGWSEIVSVSIGKKPAAPTTWSSTTTATVGDPLYLYWVHNSEDGSSQTYAKLELTIGNDEPITEIIKNSTDEELKDKTSVYEIDTTKYAEGTKILWRVRTAGVTHETLGYGDWSIQRTIDIYAPPTLEFSITDIEGNLVDTLTSFPLNVSALAGPSNQAPLDYHVVVTANEGYETVDQIGNVKMVSQGEQIYSKYFDVVSPTDSSLQTAISAGDIDLENNIPYTITCIASMNSGLTVEASLEFTVAWEDLEYEPNAEIAIDEDTIAAYIRPYYEGPNADVMLSVYRREFDGTFTEIATDIENKNTFVTDPHPALDYARYRIVAIDKATGAVSYCDIAGYPIGEKAAIIQWNEEWSYFDTTNEDEMEQPAWSGSMLKLPYNIDVSDKRNPDVALVEYIGRSHPVSYYGTQRGETSTWSMSIPKKDADTLYALRRLSIWQGDVYVREPSGSGYWANITVSFSQKHLEVTIPVTLEIARVEGGI